MIGIVVVSESRSAAEMLKTVEKVTDKSSVKYFVPVTIRSDFTKRTLRDSLNRALKKFHPGTQIIILTEVYGSTQSNVCREFLVKDEIQMIAGYNLAMLLKAATMNPKKTLNESVKELCQTGKKYIKSFKS